MITKNPKVFISYSWKSDEYKDRVAELATRLREDGVDVVLDQWDLEAGQDVYAFMEMNVRDAEKVLILCEQVYTEKANYRVGGVGAETAIITPEIYNQYNQKKFIPVLMEEPIAVPTYLKSRYAIRFVSGNDKEYRGLRDTIFGVFKPKPDLGSFPKDLGIQGSYYKAKTSEKASSSGKADYGVTKDSNKDRTDLKANHGYKEQNKILYLTPLKNEQRVDKRIKWKSRFNQGGILFVFFAFLFGAIVTSSIQGKGGDDQSPSSPTLTSSQTTTSMQTPTPTLTPTLKPTSSPTPIPQVKVPSLLGKTVAEAKEIAKKKNLSLKLDGKRVDNQYAKGLVIEQSPKSNKTVNVGTVIHYTVSSGSEQKSIPNVINLFRKEAETIMRDSGFENLTIKYEQSSTAAAGRVFKVSPDINTINAVTENITIFISTGSPQPPTATPTVLPATATTTIPPVTATPTVLPATATPTVPPATATPTVPPATATPTVPPATATPTVPPATATPTVPPATATPTTPPATPKAMVGSYYGLSPSDARQACINDGLTPTIQTTMVPDQPDGIIVEQSLPPQTQVDKGSQIVLSLNRKVAK